MPCKNATTLYKWHPSVYSKILFDSQARMAFHLPKIHFIRM